MIATTLRVTFTGAAPLLDTIRSAYSLTTAQTGLLTTLPLLAFALISPLAAPVARRFWYGTSACCRVTFDLCRYRDSFSPFALLIIWRYSGDWRWIALGNVLLPGLIKRDFLSFRRQTYPAHIP
ncbi:hypothetical protein ACLB1S_17150 [Escherichia coli]